MARLTDLDINTYNLEIQKMISSYRIPNLELLAYNDMADYLGSIIVRLIREVAYIPGPESIDIPEITIPEIKSPKKQLVVGYKIPRTWWDHFKESNFDILLRWFPVKYNYYFLDKAVGDEILQEKKVLGGKNYQARAYLPDFKIPSNQNREYRWFALG